MTPARSLDQARTIGTRRAGGAALALAVAVTLGGCATPMPSPSPSPSASAEPLSSGVQPAGEPTVIATGFTAPWSVVRLAGGTSLVSERDSALVKEISPDGVVREVGLVDGVRPGGEGGLLGLAVKEGTAGTDTSLYVFYTTAVDNRIMRIRLDGKPGSFRLGHVDPILTGLPFAGNHNGGRIAFGPDGMLYATAGDAGQRDIAQDPASLGGKILRMTSDGAVPADNPFPDSYVYSLGHRNPQGIAWDDDGQLWASEFGQNTWDEINRIEPGANYGWPVVEGIGNNPAYVDPLYQWPTNEASPSGLAAVQGTLFAAALRGERLWAVYPGSPTSATAWFVGEFGRLRDAVAGPDGTLWILTNRSDGRGDGGPGSDSLLEVRLVSLAEG